MGWFGSGVNHEPYDKDGNPQTTGHESAAIVQSFGTNDLDHVLAAYAPSLTKCINSQSRGLRETKQMVADLTEIIKKQNQQIEEMTKKLNALER
ncbi:hypothetical protein NZ47_12040 [Anaerovibrio lipolyticus]|uniref:Uncharacterized protein n=1 Tax=Anaerovibrio lipolyticus TaxID=82374 RepID=A0A0B2JXM7_9FIRM|nr:hypothetical protein [Anaerovibrio lipolyticus]KHM50662.1 hypothetical protein NZ47_12040 [Anaerovibrio lipolyticus]